MTPEYLTNQLIFFSNEKFILDFIKVKDETIVGPPQFSFSSIKKVPDFLNVAMSDGIRRLAIMNMAIPEYPPMEATVRKIAVTELLGGHEAKESAETILATITATRLTLQKAQTETPDAQPSPLEAFEQAVRNYHESGFFCQYDWRFANWGTVEDVHSVIPATFDLPTSFIEFTTRWTPPVPVLEALASFFPSVRFELKYQYPSIGIWKKTEIFPNPPFGY